MLLSEHKKANKFNDKTLIEKVVLGTSNRCPDHLSRQFLTTLSYTYPCVCECQCVSVCMCECVCVFVYVSEYLCMFVYVNE